MQNWYNYDTNLFVWSSDCLPVRLSVRKQDIIKVTEQLIEAISNGDFESYTYVTHTHTQACTTSLIPCLFTSCELDRDIVFTSNLSDRATF